MTRNVVLAGLVLWLFVGVVAAQALHQPIFENVTPPTLHHEITVANDHLIHGRFQEADLHYQSILDRYPAHRGAQLGVASAATMQGKLQRAATQLRQILELHPTDPFALAGLAMFVPVTNRERHESGLKQALEATPEVAELHFALGNFYANQERWPEAELSYRHAVALAPLQITTYFFNHAIALEYVGDYSAAVASYQRALDDAKPHEHALRDTIAQRLEALKAVRP
ncbi:tetratricopeptide repeat protein [Chrysiogenes arsenatis]|uniref:tetratricopeptide repeat protein n=1 Tax=Chrysiogenes arsenatis TaxID=309797 RepID=UPI00041E89B9|nr:tetratricopeptide repeat protein [Chrysiogenes arsenatis]